MERLEPRLVLATFLEWDDADSHRWVGEAFGGDTNTVDWVAFDNRDVLRSQVTSGTNNYTVIRTDAFLAEDWRTTVGLQADFYQVGGAANVDVKLEVRGPGFDPIIEDIVCADIQQDAWTTCNWTFDTNLPGYDAISHLSLVFDGLANTQPTFYVDDMRLVTASTTEEWDDMDDGSRDWFYFGNWFDWGPTRPFGLDPVTHRGGNPTSPAGSLYLQWDVENGCCPGNNSAEIGTQMLGDLSDWSPYNRVRADVRISDPDAALSLFFWDADTQTGFGTPTRKADTSESWTEVTWDVPWPSSFDNTGIDEVKFIVNGIDQHPTGRLFLDNIKLVDDPLPMEQVGLDYSFASFEREDDITDFSSNWGALGVAVDDLDSHAWVGESFGGDTNVVDWIDFSGRKALRSRVTSSTGDFTVIRTEAFPAEDWRDKVSLRADIYQAGGASGVDAKLEVRGPDFNPVIESVLCNDLVQDAWQTCTWTFDTSLPDYDAVSHLSLVLEGLANTEPTFYIDNLRLVTAGGEHEWDDMDDGSRQWFYAGNWLDWGPTREFGLDPISHRGGNPTTPAGSLFLQWDQPNGVAPALTTAEVGAAHLDGVPDWGAYNRLLADVNASVPGASIRLDFEDFEAGMIFRTPARQATSANAWETLVWDLPWPSTFDTAGIDEMRVVVEDIDQLAAGTLYVDNILLVPDIAVTDATAADGSRGSLEFNFSLPADSFTGAFFSLWGNSDCKEGGPTDRCSAPETIDFTHVFGASNEVKDFEQLTFWVRGSGLTQNIYNVKVELKDARDRFENTAFRYITIDDGDTDWQKIVLDADVLNGEFWSYNQDPPDPTQMKFLVFVVESFFNAPTGTFFVDQIEFVDADDAPFDPAQNSDDAFLDLVSRRAFSYFLDWYEPTTGLTHDRSEFPDLMSIAATGFSLTALTIGAQRGWIDRQVAIDMITRTLTTLRDGQSATDTLNDALAGTNGYKGFFYHFLTTAGTRKFNDITGEGSELSSVDTALAVMGALTAKEHFADVPEIAALVDEIYERIDWDWFRDVGTNQFYLGWKPELDDQGEGRFEIAATDGGFFSSRGDGSPATWDYSTDEVMLINILAMASPTHPVPADVFYAWARNTGDYAGHELVHSFNGSFFTYVFAHLWIDFQPLGADTPPAAGPVAVDWWENSNQAAQASRQFSIDHADSLICDGDDDFATYGANSFGITAADGPDGNYHAYGALPSDPRANFNNPPEHDGTIAPYGAASAIMFQPGLAIDALKHFFSNTESWNNRLGFGDAFNLDTPDCSGPWYNRAVFGIDNGPMLLAIENARSGFLWETIGRNTDIQEALALVFEILDFGDAPDSYGTTLASPLPGGGARHFAEGPLLGTLRDRELDAETPLDGSGDDAAFEADEDGVTPIATILTEAASETRASVALTVSQDALLDAWIDFNRDGVFDDPSEHLAGGASIAVSAGLNVLDFSVPAGSSPGDTFARFRVSLSGGLLPTGLADDGEVEYYAVTMIDGDAGNATVEIVAPAPGELSITADGDDIVVRRSGIELFRGPGSSLATIRLFGTTGNDSIAVGEIDAIFGGNLAGDAGDGNDTLRLTGAGQSLDLTNIADADLQGIEAIDVVGSGGNTLTLDLDEVRNISAASDELAVRSDDDDTVNFGGGWTLTGTRVANGVFYRVLQQQGATLLLNGPRNFQHPLTRFDVNNDGTPAAPNGDILPLINEINHHTITDSQGNFFDPASITFSRFLDVNGDGLLTAVGDVLPVINEANRPKGNPEGEQGEDAPPGLPFAYVVVAGRYAVFNLESAIELEPLDAGEDEDPDALLPDRNIGNPWRPAATRDIDRLFGSADADELLDDSADWEEMLELLAGAPE